MRWARLPEITTQTRLIEHGARAWTSQCRGPQNRPQFRSQRPVRAGHVLLQESQSVDRASEWDMLGSPCIWKRARRAKEPEARSPSADDDDVMMLLPRAGGGATRPRVMCLFVWVPGSS